MIVVDVTCCARVHGGEFAHRLGCVCPDDWGQPAVSIRVGGRLADYDRRLPCRTESARLNHAAHGEVCTDCEDTA